MSKYPATPPGTTIRAKLLASMLPDEVYKTSETTRASNTTLTDDPDLQFALEANATYFVEFHVRYACLSAAGFRVQFNVPSGASGNYGVQGLCSTVSDAAGCGDARFGVHNFSTITTFGDRDSASNQVLAVVEALITTGSTAGTVALAWAQETSNATATKVAAGSYGRLKRVA
ncbi:hypothetical protein [Streptomyces sp. NPDC050164]|uniref:hypothetical protein n=1 Tax=Streptomyces sp. NPDC050164 TaxID=3365605 RepID=UPI0037AFCA65